jgi:methyl-accepting chemotaxis protein
MTAANDPNDRLDHLEQLLAQTISVVAETSAKVSETSAKVAETSQQIREVSTQIKAQATFHDRFDQELTELRKLIQSNAKAIQASSDRELERARNELAAIRELRRTIRTSHAETLDRNNALQESIEDLRDLLQERGPKDPSN